MSVMLFNPCVGSRESFDHHHCLYGCPGIENGVHQDRHQRRPAAPAYPSEQESAEKYGSEMKPVVLEMRERPKRRNDDNYQDRAGLRSHPTALEKAAEKHFFADRRNHHPVDEKQWHSTSELCVRILIK